MTFLPGIPSALCKKEDFFTYTVYGRKACFDVYKLQTVVNSDLCCQGMLCYSEHVLYSRPLERLIKGLLDGRALHTVFTWQ